MIHILPENTGLHCNCKIIGGLEPPCPPNGDAPASLQPSGNVLIESYYLERETVFIIAQLIIRFYKRDIVNAW